MSRPTHFGDADVIPFLGPSVPCKHCGRETNSTGTGECDRCWNLRTSLYGVPRRALRSIQRELRRARWRGRWRRILDRLARAGSLTV